MTDQPDTEVLTDLSEFADHQPSADTVEVEPEEADPGEEVGEGAEPARPADVPDPYEDFDGPQDDKATKD